MNLLVLISSIGALFSTAPSPIDSTPIPNATTGIIIPTNITTTNLPTKECYYYFQRLHLDKVKNISNIFQNATQQTEKCKKSSNVCGSIIKSNRIGVNDTIQTGCMRKKQCLSRQSSIWKSYLDFDHFYTRHREVVPLKINECCTGDLCNTLENLPKMRELLNSASRTPEAHDKLCPGYSKNYKQIEFASRHKSPLFIKQGSSLSLRLVLLRAMDYGMRPVKNYKNTRWEVLDPQKTNSFIPLISFAPDGTESYYQQSHYFFMNNKFFYITADQLHICNLTESDNGLQLKHIDTYALPGKKPFDHETLINIITKQYNKEGILSTASTTKYITQTTKYITQKIIHKHHTENNYIGHIIASLALGITCVIIISCIVKECCCKSSNHEEISIELIDQNQDE